MHGMIIAILLICLSIRPSYFGIVFKVAGDIIQILSLSISEIIPVFSKINTAVKF